MTPSEFKSWFQGYTEDITKLPTAKQWTRIKEMAGEIDGRPTTEKVFVERWWSQEPCWYDQQTLTGRIRFKTTISVPYNSNNALYY